MHSSLFRKKYSLQTAILFGKFHEKEDNGVYNECGTQQSKSSPLLYSPGGQAEASSDSTSGSGLVSVSGCRVWVRTMTTSLLNSASWRLLTVDKLPCVASPLHRNAFSSFECVAYVSGVESLERKAFIRTETLENFVSLLSDKLTKLKP